MEISQDDEMFQKMRAGELYLASGPTITELGAQAKEHMERYNSLTLASPQETQAALHTLFGSVGAGVVVRPPVYVDYGIFTSIGEGTFMNYGCVLLDVADITIGAHCQFAPGVKLLTAWHPLEARPRSEGLEAASPITIGDNVWLGADVLVLPGIEIGDNTVVGAGSVVTKNLPPNVVAFGNPAKVQRSLPEDCPERA